MSTLRLPIDRGLRRKLLEWICGLGLFALGGGSLFALEGQLGIHDPSTVILCDGDYYVFGTGRGIPFLTSSNGFDWRRGGNVFDRVPDSVKSFVPKNNGSDIWAPDIIRLNGQYYLYYSISSWGQFVSAVGLLTSPTLNPKDPNYKWTDRGMVVHSVAGENLNAIDPGVCQAPDGTLWISYGSYHGNIELVELDPVTGLRIATNSPVSIIASQSEASDIIFHQGYYYLFVNHGSCCAGANSTYNIRVGRTQKITGPYLDKYGEDLARGAGTLFLAASGKQIGPGHFGFLREDGVEKFSCHYEANLEKGGRSMLDLRPLLWSADGWPLAGENVPDGTYQVRSLRTGTVLQAPGNATNGNRGLTARYLVQAGQKWVISAAGSGYCKITSAASPDMDKVLEESEGGAVAVAPFVGADRQLWKLDQVSDGSYRIASKADKLALTATFNIKPGNGIALQAYRGDDSQHWVVAAP